MRNTPPTTPLLALLRDLGTDAKRQEFATEAGTTVAYLYQLAGCNRRSCRADLAAKIAAASVTISKKYGTPAITVEVLATMCACDVPSA